MTATATETDLAITVDRASLANALKAVRRAVTLRSPKAILTGVLIRAESGLLELTATDLELFIRVRIPNVEVKQPGAWVAPYAQFTAIVAASEDTTLNLSHENGALVIAGSDSRFKLFGWPASDFPAFVEDAGGELLNIDADEFKAGLLSVVDAVGKEISKYTQTAIQFDKGTLVATDGHRMHVRNLLGVKSDTTLLLPQPLVTAFLSLPCEGEASISTTDNRCVIQCGDSVIACTTPEGTFPPYKDVMPKKHTGATEVDSAMFVNALRRASVLTSEETKGVILGIGQKSIAMSSRTAEVGEASIEIPATHTGDTLVIGMNPKYLLDAVEACNSERVTIETTAANRPMVVRGGDFLGVVMPVQLQ